jgi:hypothetical protein
MSQASLKDSTIKHITLQKSTIMLTNVGRQQASTGDEGISTIYEPAFKVAGDV